MSFVSYAQNFEDVMLWRALKHVQSGFYIDIGAAGPDVHSVTKAFYEHDWVGINVEPNTHFHQQLIEKRPRDINLQQAVGDYTGSLSIFFMDNPDLSGLSTAIETIAHTHQEAGWTSHTEQVKVTTLANICRQHVPPNTELHFLKIDVEGMEKAVLEGNDWAQYRPWIVVIEATLPTTQQECHENWEPILHAAHYHFAYADGLNRFYVANEHAALLPMFKYPPGVWDDYVSITLQQAYLEAQQSKVNEQEACARAEQANLREQEAYAKVQQMEIREQEAYAKVEQANRREQEAYAKAQQMQIREQEAYAKAREASMREQEACAKAQQMEIREQAAYAKVQQMEIREQEAHAKAQRAERVSNELLIQCQALYRSNSWRVTTPLRVIGKYVRWIVSYN